RPPVRIVAKILGGETTSWPETLRHNSTPFFLRCPLEMIASPSAETIQWWAVGVNVNSEWSVLAGIGSTASIVKIRQSNDMPFDAGGRHSDHN
ncbi:MAG TPA: hypothetical protein VK687_06720, partial [Bryobacteraceae bacterium]|nr:hypothetical protein [Bryobacteraceae bacterium]